MTTSVEPAARLADPARVRGLTYLPATAFVLDFAVIVAGILIAAQARQYLSVFVLPADVSESVAVTGPLLAGLWLLCIGLLGGYSRSTFGAGTEEFKSVARGSVGAAAGVGIACYLTSYPLSRGFYVLAFVIGLPALMLVRALLRRALHRARRRGVLTQRVLIAGTPAHIDEVAGVLLREAWLGYDIVGALTPTHDLSEATTLGIPVLGSAEDVVSVAEETRPDVLLIASGAFSSATQMRRIAWDLEQHAVQVVVAPSVTDVSRERVKIRPVGGLPLMHLEGPRAMHAARWGKRIFDLVGSGLLILMFSPVLLAVAVVIKLDDRGPVLFRQTRVGRDGAEFDCLKFRTMVTDAESLLARLLEQQGFDGGLFKMEDDPRITRVGRRLRRFSLDELPQLFNVFAGHMSLVGPRPPLPREVALYEADTHRRLRVRPGMTGLWQVSGRSDLSWSEAVRLDLYYVDNWSMIQDLSILARTAGAVIGSSGAY
jgi:exopolysaccharide biosynthesis polyprenyl glycosylphosphotransferase